AEVAVREGGDSLGNGGVVDQRRLILATAFDVPVERVVAAVHTPAREPAVEGRAGIVEHALPRLVPVDRSSGFAPERLGVVERPPVDVVKATHRLQRRARRPLALAELVLLDLAGRRLR